MNRRLFCPLLLCLLTFGSVGWSAAAVAQSKGSWWQGFGPSSSGGGSRHQWTRQTDGTASEAGISAGQAAAIVRRSGAKVLDVRRAEGGYLVKLITPKGRVRTVWVNERTGELSR